MMNIILEKLKVNWQWIILSAAILLLILNIKQCNQGKEDAAKYIKFDQSISSINDNLVKVKNAQGDTVFTKHAVEFALKELVKSESFKSLSEENKKFYLELQKVKGLIASSQATINSQAEIIKNLSYGKGVTVTDSSVCFKKGSGVMIEDTSKSLIVNQMITFGDKLKSDMRYTYRAEIQTSFIRNKDKTISIEYKLDDPNANMINGNAFIIPIEERTAYQKFMDKNGRWIKPITYGITFSTGAYLTYKVIK